MQAVDDTILVRYSDLGPAWDHQEGPLIYKRAFCKKVDADVFIDLKTWQSWQGAEFEGELKFKKFGRTLGWVVVEIVP